MPRIANLTGTLRGRGVALAFVGAAAALAGTGTVSAAIAAQLVAQPTAHNRPAAISEASGPVSLVHASSPLTRVAGSKHEAAAVAVKHAPAVQHAAAHPAATAQHQPAPSQKPVPAHRAAPAHKAAPSHRAAPRPAAPKRSSYLIYDSVTPSAIPAHHEIATYATGGYAVSPAQVHGKKVLWIDTNGSDTKAAALDVEPGDATPQGAATWAQHKLASYPASTAIIYTMRSEWPAAKAAVAALPQHMRSHVKWWIADPTGVAHIVPGASATQWFWGKNFDITTAKANF